MSEPRKLLLIAYYFPPVGGAGTQRAVKFCKHLPRCGWDVTVITGSGDAAGRWAPSDETLVGDVGEGVRVMRVGSGGGASRLTPTIDRHQGWSCSAIDAAAGEWRSGSYDAVLITMSPFSLAHIGEALARDCGAPVVYDLRDPWTLDGWPTYRHIAEWWVHRRFMRRVLSGAAGVIANTPEAARCIGAVVPGLDKERLCVIPNGYDAEDFSAIDAPPVDPEWFTLVHTGSLHSSVLYPSGGLQARLKRQLLFRPERLRPEGRTLVFLLEAIKLLRQRRPHLARRLRLVAVGSSDGSTKRSVEESGVSDCVDLVGYVPHLKSVEWLMRGDALFLPLHGLPQGKRSRIVPGKTYEYLASGRPVLACVPEGDARDLINASGVGFVADPCDPDAICDRLVEMVSLWHDGGLPRGPEAWVADYERGALTERLAAHLGRVIGSGHRREVQAAC